MKNGFSLKNGDITRVTTQAVALPIDSTGEPVGKYSEAFFQLHEGYYKSLQKKLAFNKETLVGDCFLLDCQEHFEKPKKIVTYVVKQYKNALFSSHNLTACLRKVFDIVCREKLSSVTIPITEFGIDNSVTERIYVKITREYLNKVKIKVLTENISLIETCKSEV